MKRYQKEIAITLVCLLIAGGFVYYFFQSIKWEKQEAKANSYLLVPSSVEAMLFVDKSENLFLNKLKQTDKSDFLSRYIPPLYLDLFHSRYVMQTYNFFMDYTTFPARRPILSFFFAGGD